MQSLSGRIYFTRDARAGHSMASNGWHINHVIPYIHAHVRKAAIHAQHAKAGATSASNICTAGSLHVKSWSSGQVSLCKRMMLSTAINYVEHARRRGMHISTPGLNSAAGKHRCHEGQRQAHLPNVRQSSTARGATSMHFAKAHAPSFRVKTAPATKRDVAGGKHSPRCLLGTPPDAASR